MLGGRSLQLICIIGCVNITVCAVALERSDLLTLAVENAKDLCNLYNNESYLRRRQVDVKGSVDAKILKMLGEAGIAVDGAVSEETWRGVQQLRPEAVGEYAKSYQECVEKMSSLFLNFLSSQQTQDKPPIKEVNGCITYDSSKATFAVKDGMCFSSPDRFYRSNIKLVKPTGMAYVNFEGREFTCKPGDLCNFGWPSAPDFVVNLGSNDGSWLIVKKGG